MIPAIHRDQCRVCLGAGFKQLFTPTKTTTNLSFPVDLQYDRLAEKLRFVSMQPVIDSIFLPSMLCFTCIVQLNLAYNFKNVAIETHMHLDRHNIERGITGAPPTPSISTTAMGEEEDEDRHSILSSASRQVPPPTAQTQSTRPTTLMQHPPPSTVSISTATDGSPISRTDQSSDESGFMLDPSQIKREVEDEPPRIFRRVIEKDKTSYIQEFTNSAAGGPRTPKRKAAATPTTTAPLQKKRNNTQQRQPSMSPAKRPMVALHRMVIDKDTEKDREYLHSILNAGQKRPRDVAEKESAEDRLADISVSSETYSSYDLINSKMLRELLNNLPKSRLRRSRRTST